MMTGKKAFLVPKQFITHPSLSFLPKQTMFFLTKIPPLYWKNCHSGEYRYKLLSSLALEFSSIVCIINSQLFHGISSPILSVTYYSSQKNANTQSPPWKKTPLVVLTSCNQRVTQDLWNKWWQGSSVMTSSLTYSQKQIAHCSRPTSRMKKKNYHLVFHLSWN